ncbi:uncharacterized protein LOC9636569 [Selaginella moellendorffii]|nr:uncharacterized protein LOC9636569 [Selaginella moellendorffii]|eukprot:XP_002993935.2 uncharacterized protein LOC9636569 [Selaginella moellendorffii]
MGFYQNLEKEKKIKKVKLRVKRVWAHFLGTMKRRVDPPLDTSKVWAATVLQPFPFSVLELDGLRRALSHILPLALPLGSATFAQLADDDEIAAAGFAPNSPAESIVSLTTAFMGSSAEMDESGKLLESAWDQAFCNLWMKLLKLAGITTVEFNRSIVMDSLDGSTRADPMLWSGNRLCAKFEERRQFLQDAQEKLEEKVVNLEPRFYGPVPWIIGVALAGQEMAAWAMIRGSKMQSQVLVGPLKLTSMRDKFTCLRFSINLLRVALTLKDVVSSSFVDRPRPFRTLPPAFYGAADQIERTLWLDNGMAIKEICPWTLHVSEGFTTMEFVRKAYGLQAEGIVPGEPMLMRDRYRVTMKAVECEPPVCTEAELLSAVLWILRGLEKLHEAGLVHRDVRWENVARSGGGYVLIDLETVWEAGDEPECSLLVWGEETLVGDKYTEQSDLYLVGKMMYVVEKLSPATQEFQSRLLGYEFASARTAIENLIALQN